MLLLCGTVPAYRDLHAGDAGKDVRQLNRNLHVLGYDAGRRRRRSPSKTETALKQLQHDKGLDATGALGLGDAVFLPEPVRIAKVTGELGGPPGRVHRSCRPRPTRSRCRWTSRRRSRAR